MRRIPSVRFLLLAVLPPFVVFTVSVTGSVARSGMQAVRVMGYEIVNEYPHDPGAYTQGLYFEDGSLFEGTGRYGQSALRQVELETGRVVRQVDLPSWLFGEGVAALGGLVYQLTWEARVGFIYDPATFERRGRFSYDTEGWGLTHDGRYLIMSDGSSVLSFRDPQSFAEVRRVRVFDRSGAIEALNELEFINGRVWANVWHRDDILQIDPESGAVVGRIDLTGLLGDDYPLDSEGVLNGIAYDSAGDRIFVTGKLWPRIFEIRVVPQR